MSCILQFKGNKVSIAKSLFSLLGVLGVVCLLAIFSQPAAAQVEYGSFVGNVTDASGAAVPGAAIKITLPATGETHQGTSDASGGYTITTVSPGDWSVEVSKQGFRTFVVDQIHVNVNNVVRVNAQLQVGALTEKVEVTTEAAAALQTERADVHTEVSTAELLQLPQPNYTYEGLLELVPGTAPPAGQLSGGTNNPSKSETFAFNGTGTAGAAVRIEGINAINPWNRSAQSVVPSVNAVENMNVATSAADAEQGLANGVSVNVILKSGTNATHGGIFGYNSVSATEANYFFSNAVGISKPPHLVDNDTGAYVGGHIIKNKLFYFGSYEGDLSRTANSGVLSLPNINILNSGNLSASPNPIYDPLTGTATGANRTPFPNNQVPLNRFDRVTNLIIPNIPAPNTGGALNVNNNFFINDANAYNLHKLDTKFDYQATNKLHVSYRMALQPFYDFQQPIYGPTLGGSSGFATAGAGNYLQHGEGSAFSVAATYVVTPTFVIDAEWGRTSSHQLLFPNLTNERYGLDVLGIPGTNNGPLPWTGGVPNFSLPGFVTMGASYPALDYIQPVYEYVANATKIKGSHTIRFGVDLDFQHPLHIEDRNNIFTFNGSMTTELGGPGANNYNEYADFMLGAFDEGQNWLQTVQQYLSMRTWEDAIYVRDQWHVNSKLTLNYGVRWEYYPQPTRDAVYNLPNSVAPGGLGSTGNGMYYLNMQQATVSVCGAGGIPTTCGVSISKRLFAPSIGVAYRPFEKFVIRLGYSLSPDISQYGIAQMQAYPGEVELDKIGANVYTPAGFLSTGLPNITAAPGSNSVYPILPNTGNLTAVQSQPKYVRGYVETYNFTIQRELPFNLLGSVGYVGTHAVKLESSNDINYGQVGGGPASQPLAFLPDYSTGISTPQAWGADKYNSLQAQMDKRMSSGLTFHGAFTYSKDIGKSYSIAIPQYQWRDYYPTTLDRTFHLVLSAGYELPFGKNKPMLTSGVGAAIAGGWSLQGIFNHYSGTLFTVTASGSSLNAPGSTQTANLINPSVAQVGNGIAGTNVSNAGALSDAWFNPLAYAPVTAVAFGTGGFDQLRGPGNTNMDMNIFRNFNITERFKLQVQAQSFNLTNTPHFSNPSGTNVSNMTLNPDGTLKTLGGFMQITTVNPLGRLLDQRNFRFGVKLMF